MKRSLPFRKPGALRLALWLLIGALLIAVGVVLVVVLENVDASADMRKEAREAVLLAEMDTAVQRVAVAVDGWVSDDAGAPVSGHPVLDRESVSGNLASFDAAVGELGQIIKADEQHLIVEMTNLFAAYQVELVNLDASGLTGADLLVAYHGRAQPIERSFRETLLDLQNEEILHLEESVVAVRNSEHLLRWLVPSLLVLVAALALGIRRLADRARGYEEARALNASRNAFIASVSHEIRTPLTTVIGLAHEMHSGLDSYRPEEIEEFAGLIVAEGEEVAGIVEDLLVAARSETGDLAVVSEDVDLQAQVNLIVRSDHVLAERNTTITVNGDPMARADAARVRQILRNLLANAGRYGGPSIEVGIERHNGLVRLWVADDGPGISQDDRQRIFEPFQRAHEIPGVPASVGLGLTVSRHLARVMGGDLHYRDEGRTCLELTLPSADPVPATV